MMMLLDIVSNEGEGDIFTIADVACLLTNIMGFRSSVGQIQGVFKHNQSWFISVQDGEDRKAYRYRLLQGAKDSHNL